MDRHSISIYFSYLQSIDKLIPCLEFRIVCTILNTVKYPLSLYPICFL